MTNDALTVTTRLLLVDGHAQAYRAFHAIPALTSPQGQPVNAIFGFIKILDRLLAEWQPTHVAVLWDGGLAAERMEIWPEYKAQRPPMPESLAAQLDSLQSYLPAAGYVSICQDGIEADDLIATLARRTENWAQQVIIASADKDFMQLVDGRVGLVNPNDKTPIIWTEATVVQKTGVKPRQIVDWLSLMGDKVDNIPGVPGLGPKTATKLLNQFGSVESLYAKLAEITSANLREKLAAAESAVRRNQRMVRLKEDLPLAEPAEQYRRRPPQTAVLAARYGEWGFKSLAKALAMNEPEKGAQQAEFSL